VRAERIAFAWHRGRRKVAQWAGSMTAWRQSKDFDLVLSSRCARCNVAASSPRRLEWGQIFANSLRRKRALPFFNARAGFSLIACEIRERSVLRNQSDVIRRATVRARLRQRAVALRHHARRKRAPSALAEIRRYRDRHKTEGSSAVRCRLWGTSDGFSW